MRECCRLRCDTTLWPILTATVAFLVPSLAAWAVEPITISLVPVSTEIDLDGSNDPLVIDIRIDNPEQELVKSWMLDLFFDMVVFNPLSGMGSVPAQGFELGNYIPGVFGQWNEDYVPPGGVDPDRARMGAMNIGTQTGSDLTGLLGRVSIDVLGTSPGSTLWLQGQIILAGGETENVVFGSTEIIVNTPEPATAMLLLAGLCLCRRRQRRL